MKLKLWIATGVLLLTMGLFVELVSAQQPIDTGPTPDNPEIHGGLLYDNWWNHLGLDAPEGDHPLWAAQDTNTRTGTDTWRCKECHGWDYLGVEGAYGAGSHLTGFPGVFEAQTKSTDEIVAALNGDTNPDHDFSLFMSDEDLTNLAVFIQGLRDYRQHVDYSAKAPIGGDAAAGQALFDEEEGCNWCHGPDGTEINFGDEEEPEFLGTIAVDNPQEFLHKAIYGQPASDPRMTAMIERNWTVDDIINIMAYAQTLPTGIETAEAAPAAVEPETETEAETPATMPETGGQRSDISLLLIVGGALFLGVGFLSRKKMRT